MSALRLITESSVTSAVNHVEIQNCFTDDFDVYQIQVSDMSLDGTTHATVGLRLMSNISVLSDSKIITTTSHNSYTIYNTSLW